MISLKTSYCAEKWFCATAGKLQIKGHNPTLKSVKSVLKKHLKSKFERVENYWITNPLDVVEYLDLILKCDAIIELENEAGRMIRVAVDVTLNSESVDSKVAEVSRLNFHRARTDLGIDRHWVIVLPENFLDLDMYRVVGKFYECIDNKTTVDVVKLF